MPAPPKKSPEGPKQRKLTPAQRLFGDYVIEGRAKNEAYRLAYPQSSLSPGALTTEAYRTSNRPNVAEYITEALQERRREVLLTRDKKRQILGAIALNPKARDMARIAAVGKDNDMTGDNAPVRIEGEITLHAIFTALRRTTGLLAAGEAKAIEGWPDRTALPPVGGPGEEELTPAMERAHA